jgi:hypothetical protein
VMVDQGDVEQAVRLAAAFEVGREKFGTKDEPHFRAAYEKALTCAHVILGEDAFAIAWESGRQLSLEQAVAEALAATFEPPRSNVLPLEK